MGRPKVFPKLFDDLVAKHKSKAMAEKEYKTYMFMAKEQMLDKNARLSDIKHDTNDKAHEPHTKKQRVSGGFSNSFTPSEKELYERLVEAEKARGDDLREIALRLASAKKEDVVIPPSPAADDEAPADENKESTPQHGVAPASAAPETQREARSKQQGKHKSGAGGAAVEKPKGTPFH